MRQIDINCDMGESTTLWPYQLEHDLAILPFISSVNIACGFHAGDPHTMHELVDAALQTGVAVGAHPGFEDRANFGRSTINLSPTKLYDIVIYQIAALDGFLKIHGTRLHHVKPHGAMYNMAAKDPVMSLTICNAIRDYNDQLLLYALSGSELFKTAQGEGLLVCAEVFADRTYEPDGTLTPRSRPGAVIQDESVAVAQVMQIATRGTIQASGKEVAVQADTVCIHSDGANALGFAQKIFDALQDKAVEIKPA